MLAPRDLQTAFLRALLEQNDQALQSLLPEIVAGELTADERLAVYRNNVFASLTEVLKETFPVVCRLVDNRFFGYAAHQFIAAHPPQRPALIEYGGAFPDFLANFPPCRELAYLPDIARFEWLMNAAAHAPDATVVSPDSVPPIAPEDAAHVRFALNPSYGYLESKFPIDEIWRANRPGTTPDSEIGLAGRGVWLEVSRQNDDVVFRELEAPTFTFRRALARGDTFGAALQAALSSDANFAVSDQFSALFGEGAVTAVILMEHSA